MEINGVETSEEIRYDSLNLSPEIMSALDKKGFVNATPIQGGCIPFLLENQDIVAKAPTGTGKTFAVRTWADRLNPNTTKLVYMCMSTLTNNDFYRQLAGGFGIQMAYKKCDLFRDIQECVRSLACERRMRVVVVIDEAHMLHTSVLRDLQMLTNFEMDSKDYLSVVLVGHSVLAQQLSRQPYESLRQRLVVTYRMQGLDEAAARDYVRSMLARSGADPDLFDDAALAAAHGSCGGRYAGLTPSSPMPLR